MNECIDIQLSRYPLTLQFLFIQVQQQLTWKTDFLVYIGQYVAYQKPFQSKYVMVMS